MQTPLIEEYSLIRAEDARKLVANVMAAIRDGFQPLGGVAVSNAGVYMQAVVKYEGAEFDPMK